MFNNNAIETFLRNVNISKLKDEQKDLCKGKIYRESAKVSLILFRITKL